MYNTHFGFVELPFSIVPNSRFLYLSQRHKEAMHHLQAGLGDGGGFAMLTGEVGTGKTTVSKAMLKALDGTTQTGCILNPTFSNSELLEAICDEFSLAYPEQASLKQLTQLIKQFLLDSYAQGQQTLLLIDEAQHLSAEVLEQLRLLTNLETEQRKLLKVLLIGQPELQKKLQMPQLRQLAQRITGRYHLLPLDGDETAKYIQFRLQLAGGNRDLFSAKSLKHIAQATLGIPRLVNLVCDAALKRAYHLGEAQPSQQTVLAACEEVMSFQSSYASPAVSDNQPALRYGLSTLLYASLGGALALCAWFYAPQYLQQPFQQQAQIYIEQHYPAKPNRVEQQEVFPSELTALLSHSKPLASQIDELYKVWGYRASVVDTMCLDNAQSQFHCQSFQGSFEQLLATNLPAVLTLTVDQATHYALLYKASNEQVELLIDGQRVAFERQWLDQIWSGEYYLIWQKLWHQALKPGMSGHPVASLDYQLSEVLGLPMGETERYGEVLKQKVTMFQQWQGLSVDGIAGQRTLQRLELLSQDQAPSLMLSEAL
ncbi:AAA family ATPase [Vibrio scophthalmi]|uniref:ExeA family protein n=1 Tax=Vibrio scophthalmi TaxID=45658 RepID=UPI0022834563|nr:ExeA family protein [Vibrio scophthalmi]MCY9805595.1 AAA family ATPase [Vibrio scophthalmi]